MAIGQLVTSRWARIQARAALLVAPIARLPRYVFASDVDRVPLDTDEYAQWPVPGSAGSPSPLNLFIEGLWTILANDDAAQWIQCPTQTWTADLAPSLPYTIRAMVYYTSAAAPGAVLMGVVRLPVPVVWDDAGQEFQFAPEWPVRSGVRVG